MTRKGNSKASANVLRNKKFKQMQPHLTEAVVQVHNHGGKETRTLRRLWTTVPNVILYMGSQVLKKITLSDTI